MKVKYNFWIDVDLKKELDKIAERENRHLSQEISYILNKYIEDNKKDF